MIVKSDIPCTYDVADGDEDGVPDTELDGELDVVPDTELDGVLDTELDGVLDGVAETELDGVLDTDAEDTIVPTLPSKISQRYVLSVIETLISDRKSLASANVASVSKDEFNPAAAVTTTAPPPSVLRRNTKRIPGFVGVASVRVSAVAPDTISQICRSCDTRIVPASPGSVSNLPPRYNWWCNRCALPMRNNPFGKRYRA